MVPKKKVENNLVDIAKALNVSPATVSRALSNHPRISEATKKRVRKKAAEMGYQPNAIASSLRRKSSNVVGLIVPRISMYFHALFITALQNQLQEAGFHLIICQSNDSREVEETMAGTLYASQVAALVVSLSLWTTGYEHFDRFIEKGIPVYFFDRVPDQPYPGYMFKGDDYRGGYLAGSHFIELGCKNIGFISGPLTSRIYQERDEGFRFALSKAGLQPKERWTFYQELTRENAISAIRKMFTGATVPDAVFACNDTTALEVLEYAVERGIEVPAQLKVIGYSNDPRTGIIRPGITTIEQHPAQMAQNISQSLIELLKTRQTSSRPGIPEITPVSLIRRMST